MNIDRDRAMDLVQSKVTNKNLIKHMLAVEAVMRALAVKLEEDVDIWGLTGLLHDLDYTTTVDNPDRHAYETCEMLENELPSEALHAILSHPGHVEPESKFDWALLAADPVTGFIVAAALMHPTKTLKAVELKFLKNRFKEKRFAAGANREQIALCERIGMELDEFLQLSLEAMQDASDALGL